MYVVSARLQSLTGKSIHNLFYPKLTLMWSSDLRSVCCFYFSLVQFNFIFLHPGFYFPFFKFISLENNLYTQMISCPLDRVDNFYIVI